MTIWYISTILKNVLNGYGNFTNMTFENVSNPLLYAYGYQSLRILLITAKRKNDTK